MGTEWEPTNLPWLTDGTTSAPPGLKPVAVDQRDPGRTYRRESVSDGASRRFALLCTVQNEHRGRGSLSRENLGVQIRSLTANMAYRRKCSATVCTLAVCNP
ncbi:hypothetical protein MDOR_09970 [Mycolicibacterium doricum]|uniref:Uncharacterized protein n=1 Tax=Mycolicibacterium doricum TaxID=126673 RepID=A0A7I7VTN1_9MYCO|nr:hypothetical protein MDOR_09970 [Mycolicibacterium doricum]